MLKTFGSLLALIFFCNDSQGSWILKRIRHQDQLIPIGISRLASAQNHEFSSFALPKVIKSFPETLAERNSHADHLYEEVFWPYDSLPAEYSRFAQSIELHLQDSELRTIIEQGPMENRICLTFVGDGYTLAQKEKFFTDVAGLVDDLFLGQTFQSYKSLFRVSSEIA